MKRDTDFLGRALQSENLSMKWKCSFSTPWCPIGGFNQQCQRGKLSDKTPSSCIWHSLLPVYASLLLPPVTLIYWKPRLSPLPTPQLLISFCCSEQGVYCTLQCIQKSASIFKGKDDKLNVKKLLVLWINYVSKVEGEHTQCRLLLYHLPWSDNNDSH